MKRLTLYCEKLCLRLKRRLQRTMETIVSASVKTHRDHLTPLLSFCWKQQTGALTRGVVGQMETSDLSGRLISTTITVKYPGWAVVCARDLRTALKPGLYFTLFFFLKKHFSCS